MATNRSAVFAQELRVATQDDDLAVSEMLSRQPAALKLAQKLAYSFADSIMQSTAPLTMRPQQQALCAVCHALVKYGMEKEAVLMRYVDKACLGRENATLDQECMVDALEVRRLLGHLRGSVRHFWASHTIGVPRALRSNHQMVL